MDTQIAGPTQGPRAPSFTPRQAGFSPSSRFSPSEWSVLRWGLATDRAEAARQTFAALKNMWMKLRFLQAICSLNAIRHLIRLIIVTNAFSMPALPPPKAVLFDIGGVVVSHACSCFRHRFGRWRLEDKSARAMARRLS